MNPTQQRISEELTKLCRQWDEAIERNNVSDIGKFMAPDWVIIGTEGGITSKVNFLKFVETGDLVHTKMDFSEIRIEIYDKTGIVTSKGTSSGTYKGEAFSYYEWSTNVFIQAADEWRCVLTMLTPAL